MLPFFKCKFAETVKNESNDETILEEEVSMSGKIRVNIVKSK
jgi:hypothetical protein